MTHSLLHRKLVVVTGKGGVGKTTIAAAIGLLSARQGRRTLVLQTAGTGSQLSRLFGRSTDGRHASAGGTGPYEPAPNHRGRTAADGGPTLLAPNLWAGGLDDETALAEWMQSLGGRLPARRLAAKASFQYFAAAAPGAKELVSIVKVWRLAGGEIAREHHASRGEAGHAGASRSEARDAGASRDELREHDASRDEAKRRRGGDYDLVLLDAPATGHALAMLSSPATFASIAKHGPIARQAELVREMLCDPRRTGYLGVAQASEMSVAETIELQAELRSQLHVELQAVVVNATLHRRFTRQELTRIAALREGSSLRRHRDIAESAAAAAEAAHARTRFQHSQVARLRKHGLDVLQLPLIFQPEIDLAALRRIADSLDGKI